MVCHSLNVSFMAILDVLPINASAWLLMQFTMIMAMPTPSADSDPGSDFKHFMHVSGVLELEHSDSISAFVLDTDAVSLWASWNGGDTMRSRR